MLCYVMLCYVVMLCYLKTSKCSFQNGRNQKALSSCCCTCHFENGKKNHKQKKLVAFSTIFFCQQGSLMVHLSLGITFESNLNLITQYIFLFILQFPQVVLRAKNNEFEKSVGKYKCECSFLMALINTKFK